MNLSAWPGSLPSEKIKSSRFRSISISNFVLAFFLLCISSITNAQDTTAILTDSVPPAPAPRFTSQFGSIRNFSTTPSDYFTVGDTSLSRHEIRKRVRIVAAINIVGYSAAMVGLYAAWYSQYEKTSFHTFNDWKEWLQTDKVGHMYSAYAESAVSMELWRWTGIDRKKRIWLGGMSGAVYQTVIEVLDGFSEGWGWSWADFGANILGSGILVAQELAWDEQRIKLKFSVHRKTYDDPELNMRSDELFGESSIERYLKDYNGQTYWASVSPRSFFKESNWPAWLSVAVGYGSEGLFGGTENIATDADGNVTFYRPDVKRYRQWFLAPDIDLSRIKTRKKGRKIAVTLLNMFKFPAPSLEFSNGKLRVHAVHF